MQNIKAQNRFLTGLLSFLLVIVASFAFVGCDLGGNSISTDKGDSGQSGQGDNGQQNNNTQTTDRLLAVATLMSNATNVTYTQDSYGTAGIATEIVNNYGNMVNFINVLLTTSTNDDVVVSTTIQKLIDLNLITQTQISQWIGNVSTNTTVKFVKHSTTTKITVKFLMDQFYMNIEFNFDSTGNTCQTINVKGVYLVNNGTTHGSQEHYDIAENSLYYLTLFGTDDNQLVVDTYNEVFQEGTNFNNLAVGVTL